MGMGGQLHDPAALLPAKRPGTHWQESGWAPGWFWTGAENLASTEIKMLLQNTVLQFVTIRPARLTNLFSSGRAL